MGRPSHKRDPYHSHTSRDSCGSSMGMGVPLLGVPGIFLEVMLVASFWGVMDNQF